MSTDVSYFPAVVAPKNLVASAVSATLQNAIQFQPVCIGHGLDASADGTIATVILPFALGLVLWSLFAFVRPRYRQIYAAREWFPQQDLRAKRLSSSISSFLFPLAPLIPSIPTDVSDAGRSVTTDTNLFPSDDQLTQRVLSVSLLVATGWTIIGLAGALPLYLVSTPCLAQSTGATQYSGVFSAVQDLSLLRLLPLLDNADPSTSILAALREVVNGTDETSNARIRILILTLLAMFLSALPAVGVVLREFNRLVAFRSRWLEIRCGGKEMGWLSARKAPGFANWGEKRIKDHFCKLGLSSFLQGGSRPSGHRSRHATGQNQSYRSASPSSEPSGLEVDIQSLFSICDTHNIALLIAERDEVLHNLEVAETKYISSFKLATPEPSIAELEIGAQPPALLTEKSEKPERPYISRPRALVGSRHRQHPRRRNPAHAHSSFAPTSFVAPSQYYKLRSLKDMNGGRLRDGSSTHISLSDSIHQRIVGSRFQEVNRDSTMLARMPLGSRVKIVEGGVMGPSSSESILDSRHHGPNHGSSSMSGKSRSSETEYMTVESSAPRNESMDAEWVELLPEVDLGRSPVAGPSRIAQRPIQNLEIAPARPRPGRVETSSNDRRETFPLRNKGQPIPPEAIPAPHLRLQPQQPFVRPASGLDYDDLGSVYAEINQWRSRLKTINGQISDAQQDCYVDIAEGTHIKGWIMTGRGLRHLPGVEVIEGRAKEDIRWDVLQNEPTSLDSIAMWTVILVITLLLIAGMTAASSLALGMTPSISHYLPFFQFLSLHDGLGSGIATTLAPAVAVAVFVTIAVSIITWTTRWTRSVSVSAVQFLTVKIIYTVLTFAVAIWIVVVGALLFALEAFSDGVGLMKTIATGSVYMATFALCIVVSAATIVPGLLLLQPLRLWSVLRLEKDALTPRQRFRAVYPRCYNLPFASGACVVGMVFASGFSLIFPLIGPAVVILLFLSLVAHRFLIGHVYVRTLSQTGGLMQIWLLKSLASVFILQPLLLGLILLSRQLWIEGGILSGFSLGILLFVELFTANKSRMRAPRCLEATTRESLKAFSETARPSTYTDGSSESLSHSSSPRRVRGSMASVLEMMSLTLAVMPPASRYRGPLPLPTETLDDLTATERAARTHPDAPPRLPPLPFTDHAEEMTGILYAPELLAPQPIVWLPNDSAGVARSEAEDLQKYHDIHVTLDVRTQDDVLPLRRRLTARSTRTKS
ncbi:hypothetical protein PAXRUDRAFT_138207 [Paxillus rubicundulus Ve08.2h10]|uniref:CSC1/OSCA1-like 7TM region domain-containing protein n=1 Tax=Paxillus rubicundulus Ve08.2h10 TaxID=930991 RepID=A0A0D0E5D3_9AGAM|nr:hypothetical protein PAXRUDRAFT_138207 [Paxillus rubicundulus Ve08.2h10]